MRSITRLFDYSKISRSGFTLIELLVVVGMIALITGAVSTSMSSASQRARIQKATAEVATITQAILSYENHNKDHELPTMSDWAKADKSNIGFLLGKNEKSAAGSEIPVLVEAALSMQGEMRDPWGQPYYVMINVGTINLGADSYKTGYFLPNFYRLSEDQRK